MKSQQEMLYQTQVTAFVQEPKVGEIAPGYVYPEYEKEYEKEQALIRKKMVKDTVMVMNFCGRPGRHNGIMTKQIPHMILASAVPLFLFDIFIFECWARVILL